MRYTVKGPHVDSQQRRDRISHLHDLALGLWEKAYGRKPRTGRLSPAHGYVRAVARGRRRLRFKSMEGPPILRLSRSASTRMLSLGEPRGTIVKDNCEGARRQVGRTRAVVFAETGEPLAIFPDGVMQRLRVAATSALAASRMAMPEAGVLGILGSAGSRLALRRCAQCGRSSGSGLQSDAGESRALRQRNGAADRSGSRRGRERRTGPAGVRFSSRRPTPHHRWCGPSGCVRGCT